MLVMLIQLFQNGMEMIGYVESELTQHPFNDNANLLNI